MQIEMNEMDLQLEFQEVINDKIFITDRIDQLDEEIQANCWYISLSPDQAEKVDVSSFSALIDLIQENRWKELNQSSIDTNLIFYLWYDEQTGQLRFNFITDRHESLPFGCEITFVDHQEEIINQFLSSLNGHNDGYQTHTLRVYQEKIRKHEHPTKCSRQA